MKLFTKLRGTLRDTLQSAKQGVRAANRNRLYRRRMRKGAEYTEWIALNDTPSDQDRTAWSRWLAANPNAPKVSLILHLTGNSSIDLIQRSINSVQAQVYPHWELTVTLPNELNDHQHELIQQTVEKDPRSRILSVKGSHSAKQSAQQALLQSTGIWVGLLQAGDQLRQHALLTMLQTAQVQGEAQLIYPDEDQITSDGKRLAHHFKPDWNQDFLLSANYIGHVCLIARAHLIATGGFDSPANTDLAFDAMLRSTEALLPQQIVHVPHVLWHRAAGMHRVAFGEAFVSALQAHLDRSSPGAKASTTKQGLLKVQYPLPSPPPLVSIVICTRNQYKLLQTCIRSITEKTTYPQYEIIIVDNGSDEARTLQYLDQLPRQHAHIKVIRDNSPFNYSALNNMAVDHAQGEVVALLNNDIEVINDDWLTEMVAHALRPNVGCVGAKLLYPDDTIQHAGVLVASGPDLQGSVAAHYLRGIPREAPGYANRAIVTHQLTAVTAACLVIRKSTFLRVGGLDSKHLAVTYNDVDFCLRVEELGLHNIWTPHATLYHHESVSRGRDSSGKNLARFLPEQAYMKQRWANKLKYDPFYNPNFNQQRPDFLLAGQR